MLKALNLVASPCAIAKQEQRAATPKNFSFGPIEMNREREIMDAAYRICSQNPEDLETIVRVMLASRTGLSELVEDLEAVQVGLRSYAEDVQYAADRLKGMARTVMSDFGG